MMMIIIIIIIMIIMKLIKLTKSIFCYLPCHGNEWACSKKKLYFLVKIPNLNIYWSQNGKSM